MKTTLIIMAAGIGSRFGTGIKQLAKMGPYGEVIMDYSIYDAKEAGFDKVVFIIRKDIEEEFREVIGNRIAKHIEVEYVYQELDNLPVGFSVPKGRIKPWGTGQAILCCKGIVNEPFVIINADDYYGKDAFKKLHEFLMEKKEPDYSFKMGMAGFILKNTLSEHGTVTRGVCVANEQNMLTKVIETHGIQQDKTGAIICEDTQVQSWIHPDVKVSMNMWAAYPEFIDYLEQGFVDFLSNLGEEDTTKEYLIPMIVDSLIQSGEATVKILETNDHWIGITYKEDIKLAQEGFKNMVANGIYTEQLWGIEH
jgi:NDP-sugar pyrophosphorylase family protein